MMNFLKVIGIFAIYLTLSDASLLGGLLDAVGNLLVPAGVDNIDDNLELCGLKMPDLAEFYGYGTDTLSVTTEDGYILSVHCLYNPATLNSTLNPVIAMHGFMAASSSFCLNEPSQSLAFLLADRGYYVCLPNARGNGFSQGYVNASRTSSIPINPYWKFSWDQIAEFDLPAVIDKVLDWTEKSQVIYIGYSQGSTAMFALLSSNPSYNEKLSIFVALAPVVYFSHTTSPLYLGSSQLEFLLSTLYGAQFVPHTDLQGLLQFVVCTLPTAALCENLLFLAFGYSSHTNDKRLPVYLCNTPADFAWGQFLHYTQLVKVDKFQKYDFKFGNTMMYGQSSPPQYDVSQVTAPVALFHSDGDSATAQVDVQKLKSKLSKLVFVQHLNASVAFNHLDYIWAKDVAQIVYNDLFNLIKNY